MQIAKTLKNSISSFHQNNLKAESDFRPADKPKKTLGQLATKAGVGGLAGAAVGSILGYHAGARENYENLDTYTVTRYRPVGEWTCFGKMPTKVFGSIADVFDTEHWEDACTIQPALDENGMAMVEEYTLEFNNYHGRPVEETWISTREVPIQRITGLDVPAIEHYGPREVGGHHSFVFYPRFQTEGEVLGTYTEPTVTGIRTKSNTQYLLPGAAIGLATGVAAGVLAHVLSKGD